MFSFTGETCTNPQPTTITYTSRNVALSSETAYIAEFNLRCQEEYSTLDLFAEIEAGVISPVANIPEKDSYQVCIVEYIHFDGRLDKHRV